MTGAVLGRLVVAVAVVVAVIAGPEVLATLFCNTGCMKPTAADVPCVPVDNVEGSSPSIIGWIGAVATRFVVEALLCRIIG